MLIRAWSIWISLESIGMVELLCLEEVAVLRFEVIQSEMRKRRRTKAAPTQTPRTTHKWRPKIEVGCES